MRAYVITIMGHELSEQAAARCIESGREHGVEVEACAAFTPESNPRGIFEAYGWPLEPFTVNRYARAEPCLATFLSHHALWQRAVVTREPVLILEHDAVFVAPLPDLTQVERACNLGKPSFGQFKTPPDGFGPLVSKWFFPGAHGYYVTPRAARVFMKKTHDAKPADVYLSKKRFSWLQEFYPWPIEAHDWFTTIQKPVGCTAKHNKVEIV